MTSQIHISSYTNNKLNLEKLKFQSISPKYNKEFSRFLPEKIANSGRDPLGIYSDFIKTDLIKPLDRNLKELPIYVKPYQKFGLNNMEIDEFLNSNKENYDKIFNSQDNISKIQHVNENFFPNSITNSDKVSNYKNNNNKNLQNIAIKYKNLNSNDDKNIIKSSNSNFMDFTKSIYKIDNKFSLRNFQTERDLNQNVYLNTDTNTSKSNNLLNKEESKYIVKNLKCKIIKLYIKSFNLIIIFINLDKYNPNTETYNYGWEPKSGYKSVSNRSSVIYNIVSHSLNKVSGCLNNGLMDKKLLNKKKVITETLDLKDVFQPKEEKNYINVINDNKNFFRKYTGIFTNICDAANKNGNIIQPFS